MKNCHLMTSSDETYLLARFYIFEYCCNRGKRIIGTENDQSIKINNFEWNRGGVTKW